MSQSMPRPTVPRNQPRVRLVAASEIWVNSLIRRHIQDWLYGGEISWELTALCVIVVNLSNDTSIRGAKAHAVTNRSLPLMFQYQKRTTTDSLVQMVAALQFAVAELAYTPAGHASGWLNLRSPVASEITLGLWWTRKKEQRKDSMVQWSAFCDE